jgi:hypothetical protein
VVALSVLAIVLLVTYGLDLHRITVPSSPASFRCDDGIVDEQSKCEGVGPGAGCNLCLDLDRVEHMAKPTETKVRTRDGGG